MASQKLSKNILVSKEPSYIIVEGNLFRALKDNKANQKLTESVKENVRRPPRKIKRGSFLVVAERQG